MQYKILAIGPSWLGDMVMAQSLFKHLMVNYGSKAQIDVLAPIWSFDLLKRMPEVANGIELNISHRELGLKKRYKIGSELRKKKYTKAIILPNSWKAALIPFIAKIPERTGWVGEARFGLINDIRSLNIKTYSTMLDRYVALAYPANHLLPSKQLLPSLTVDLENIKILRSKFDLKNKLDPTLPILGLGIDAAFGSAKCWPEEYFIDLAYLAKKDFNVWIFGLRKDLKIFEEKRICNFSGKTTLLETIDLLSLVDVMICNDSGLMHIAASLKKKIIAIYGSTSEKFAPPLTETFKVINKNLACSPCFARVCPLKHHNCMRQIDVQEVFEQVKSL